MKRIYDARTIRHYIMENKIDSYFDTADLPFFVMAYEPGEIIVTPNEPTRHLMFCVAGEISIYMIRADGSIYDVSGSSDHFLLGDVEFATGDLPVFWAEARTQVTLVCLEMASCREQLLQDKALLRMMMHSLAEKVAKASATEATFSDLTEKLIFYIEMQCREKTLENVTEAAQVLHCSRRQLQRILKQMTDDRRLEKLGKGTYHLIEKPR